MAVLYGTMPNGQLVAVEADSQGRLVAQLANPVDPSNFVAITGSTMTGNLTVPSLNDGQLAGMRNVLINGKVSINQRGVAYGAASVGDYWADRWKKTAGGMTQIVEDGNYQPSTEYTLSGTGVTTQQITSPASGNWTIPDVPSAATNIQLEPGPVATPFEHRPIGIELALCQRYFTARRGADEGNYLNIGAGTQAANNTFWFQYYFPTEMRVGPSATISPAATWSNWTDAERAVATIAETMVSNKTCRILVTTSNSSAAGTAAFLRGDSSSYLYLDAEL